MKPVHVFDVWHIKEGRMKGILQLLSEFAKRTREQKGNLFFNIHQVNAVTNIIILFEGYSDLPAMEEHLESPHLQALFIGRILPWLEKRKVIILSELTTKEFPSNHNSLYRPGEMD